MRREAMDNLTLGLLIASYIFLAAQDNFVAFYWAARVGPRKARELIMGDPLFTETRDLLKSTSAEMRAVRQDFESLKDYLSGQNDAIKRDVVASVEKALKDVQKSVETRLNLFDVELKNTAARLVDFKVPSDQVDAMVNRVTKSAQSAVRKSLETPDMLEGFSKLLDEKLAAIPEDTDIENLLREGELEDPENTQKFYEYMCDNKVPESLAHRVAGSGPKMMRAVAKKKGWSIFDILDGGDE